MVQSLDKLFIGFKYFSIVILACLLPDFLVSQSKSHESDYREDADFKKYHKRSKAISAWQIQNLKFGAIVVRLSGNEKKLEILKNRNDVAAYDKLLAETQFVNKTIIRLLNQNVNFCKLYFIKSSSSKELLEGKRDSIFLDSTVTVVPGIKMEESFYLLLDKGEVYNSSIGFVPEDSAKYVSETGNPTSGEYLVLKNKYGHQLKKPFPYILSNFGDPSLLINSGFIQGLSKRIEFKEQIISLNGELKFFHLFPKKNWYERLQRNIIGFNYKLQDYYLKSKDVEIPTAVKPFLY